MHAYIDLHSRPTGRKHSSSPPSPAHSRLCGSLDEANLHSFLHFLSLQRLLVGGHGGEGDFWLVIHRVSHSPPSSFSALKELIYNLNHQLTTSRLFSSFETYAIFAFDVALRIAICPSPTILPAVSVLRAITLSQRHLISLTPTHARTVQFLASSKPSKLTVPLLPPIAIAETLTAC